MPVFINSFFMALLTALTFSGFISFFDDIDVLSLVEITVHLHATYLFTFFTTLNIDQSLFCIQECNTKNIGIFWTSDSM